MRLLNLFDGIGGFALAAQWAGFENVASCEIDPFCRRVLDYWFKYQHIYDKDTDMCEGKKEKGENMQLNEQQTACVEQAGKHYAAAYMLMTLAIDHIDEGDMILTRIGKMKQRIKQGARRTQQAFDDFCRDFKPLLEDAPDGLILDEFEELKGKINQVINL